MLLQFNKKKIAPYLFILPFFIMFSVFWVGPICSSFYFSLTKWNGIIPPEFIGFTNYIRLWHDPNFYIALRNTLMATIIYAVTMVSGAICIGLILNLSFLKLKSFFRTIVFLPVTISLVVVALTFQLIYSRDYGLLNMILQVLHLPHQTDWLGDFKIALWSIIFLRIWRATGYYSIIVLAGLQNIPQELYEAARMDGANTFQVIRKITLPLLKPVIVYIIIVSSIWAFQLFDEPWILNRGGPNNATLTMVIYLYENSFRFFRLGYGSAVSYILTIIIFAFSSIQFKVFGKAD